MFETKVDVVTLKAGHYEDLDFDSIDAVGMIVKLKETSDKVQKTEDFRNARTANDVEESVYKLIDEFCVELLTVGPVNCLFMSKQRINMPAKVLSTEAYSV